MANLLEVVDLGSGERVLDLSDGTGGRGSSGRSPGELFRWRLDTFPIGTAIRMIPPDEGAGIASDLERALGQEGQPVAFTSDLHVARVSGWKRRCSAVGKS